MQDEEFKNEAIVKLPGRDWLPASKLTSEQIDNSILKTVQQQFPSLVFYVKLARVLTCILGLFAVIIPMPFLALGLFHLIVHGPVSRSGAIMMILQASGCLLSALLIFSLIMVFLEYIVYKVFRDEKRRSEG